MALCSCFMELAWPILIIDLGSLLVDWYLPGWGLGLEVGMRKKSWVAAWWLVVGLMLFTSCAVPAAPETKRPPLKVEWSNWVGDYTLLVAVQKGFFKKHGVEVAPVYYDNYSNAIPDLAARQIDAGLYALGDLLVLSPIADVSGVFVYDTGGPTILVSKKSLNSVADLRGKKVGVKRGTYGEMLLGKILEKNKLVFKDIALSEVDPEMVPEALVKGDIDAGYVYAPYDQIAVDNGFKILDYENDPELMVPDIVIFHKSVINERPEEVRAFVAAWFEATDYRLAHMEECDQLIAKMTGKKAEEVKLNGEVTFFSRAENLKIFDRSGTENNSIYRLAQMNLDFMVSRGSITRLPDLTQLLNPVFLQ
jgi:NitT/TauT family transport system substrate-binding protein